MKETITVQATFIHENAAKYEKMIEDGKKITSPVTLTDIGAFIEASIDGDVIGKVETEGFKVPKMYTAILEGKGSNPKSFLVSVDSEAGISTSQSYSSLKDEIMKKGFHEEEIDKRISYMEEEAFHPSVINAVLEFISKNGNPEEAIMIKDTDPVYRKTSEISPIMKMAMAACTQSALILFGEKSTGKNVASHTAAWLLGQPEYRIGFQRDMGIDDAFGGKGTDNSAAEALSPDLAMANVLFNADPNVNANFAEGAAKFELLKAQAASIRVVQNESALLKWAHDGGVMMFDEVNMAHANLLQAIMNPLADGDKTLVVPGFGRIKLNPACVLYCGMNPGYAGTMDLNDATASRCGFLEFEQPKSIKKQLEANFESTAKIKKHIKACDDLYQDFRGAVSQGRLSNKCLNIRGFVSALKQVEAFPEAVSLADQIQVYVINACPEDERIILGGMLRDKVVF